MKHCLSCQIAYPDATRCNHCFRLLVKRKPKVKEPKPFRLPLYQVKNDALSYAISFNARNQFRQEFWEMFVDGGPNPLEILIEKEAVAEIINRIVREKGCSKKKRWSWSNAISDAV